MSLQRPLTIVFAPLLLAACAKEQPPPNYSGAASQPAASQPAASQPAAASAEATIMATSGSKVTGKAVLKALADGSGVSVHVMISGASPGDHGMHIHQKGDCSSPDGKSAGGHFNPANVAHALPATAERHLGDLGNITVTADGTGEASIERKGANLKEGDAMSFLGRAVIIHAKPDTGAQPTGAAGARIGCGEIKKQ